MNKTATTAVQNTKTRTWDEEARMLLSLIDCLVLDREAVYASSEFTSGRRFYELCRRYNVRAREQLKEQLGSDYETLLLEPNKQEGIRFARKVQEFGHPVVLTPNPFHADPLLRGQNWSQQEYLEFWNIVIRTKCHAAYFNEGWEFSNGCTFEYLVGLQTEIPLFDHENKPLGAAKARVMIGRAIEELEKEGFTLPELRKVYDQLARLSASLRA